jgi:hypothetical protein
MARKRKKARKRPSKRRSTAARRRATSRTRRSVPKRRAPKRRRTAKGRFAKTRKRNAQRKPARRKPARRRRNALTKKELASYRRAIKRYGGKSKRARGVLGRLAAKHRRRNGDVMAASMKRGMTVGEIAKGAGMAVLRGGAGFTSSLLVGHFLGQAMGTQYGPLLGNVLVIAASEAAQAKFKQADLLGHSFTAGAAVAAFYNLMNLLVQQGHVTGDLARYLAPWTDSSGTAPVVAANGAVVNGGAAAEVVSNGGNGNGLGAVVRQAALYGTPGMGNVPNPANNVVGASMQHRLNMIQQGLKGGIFDSPTTLGEYDVVDSAPAGTFVESQLAGLKEYQTYPPSMGATVEQATAGLGATVQEAFAAPSLREYVSVPMQGMGATGLRDYVNIGDTAPQFWSQSPRGQAILGQIRDAARRLTTERLASGQPVDAKFQADLKRAAMQTVQGQTHDVSMAAPVPPLTDIINPGVPAVDQGGVWGQPTGIQDVAEAMEDDDAGIFA